MTDPKLDELSAMTYLAQFPSARPKSSICIRRSGWLNFNIFGFKPEFLRSDSDYYTCGVNSNAGGLVIPVNELNLMACCLAGFYL